MTVGPYPAAKTYYLASARPKFDTELEEEAYDNDRIAKQNPFDGLVHYTDGTTKSWESDDVVGGVNNWA